jgi:ABC-type Na+ efflux pump permease subunit
MTRGRLIAEAVHLLSLGLWLGGLGIAGLSAGQIFIVMRGLDPVLPGFAGFQGAHWSVAAGHAVQPMFIAVDVLQFACVLIAGGTFALAAGRLGLSLRRVSTFLRAALILGLLAVLSYRFFMLGPEMMQSLAAYWGEAAAGETQAALAHKAVFDQAHGLDRRLMLVTLGLVLAAISAALWSLVDDRPLREAPAGSELQEPLLARR